MDRMSQHATQRPGEQSLSGKTTPHSTPAPFQSFPPPAAQPPVQIPFSDPFQTRDPFHPSSQHQRRGSYGHLGGAPLGQYTTDRAWGPPVHQPPPPSSHLPPHQPPSQMTNGQSHSHPPYDSSSRRRSLGGAGSPPRIGFGGPIDNHPLPPSFAARNMPPPSPPSMPPSSSNAFMAQAPRGPPTASPFAGVRDFSGFSSRSSGGMSISSLIGSDSAKPQTVNHSPRTISTAPSPPIKAMHPRSPTRPRSTSNRGEYGSSSRPRSPARYPEYGPPGPPHDARPPFSHDIHRVFASQPTAPPPQPPPFANSTIFRPYQSSPSSVVEHPHPSERYPPRPSSQPANAFPQERDVGARHDGNDQGQFPAFRQYTEQPSQSAGPPLGPPASHHDAHLDRPAVFAQRPQSPGHGHPARVGVPSGAIAYGKSSGAPLREEYAGLFRPSFHPPYGQTSQEHGATGRDGIEAPSPQMFRPRNDPPMSPTSSEPSGFDRFRSAGPPHAEGRTGHDHSIRRDGEEIPTPHRSWLGISPEVGRRGSPLPQAVQGAQPRMMGPGRDSAIKNEFGRMFSGLGSGVGGTNTPIAGFSANGTSTPSRMMSPARYPEEGEVMQSAETNSTQNGTAGSRKKGRKAKASSTKVDSEDGRNTPTASQNGNKRVKTSHAAHHHHHHAHAHQHHHHHHHHALNEEQTPQAESPFNTLRFPPPATAVPQSTAAAAAVAHHHHHHHTNHVRAPHHHHHNAKPVANLPAPKTQVISQVLLETVTHIPRSHLGSGLYNSKLSLPSNKRSTLDSKFAFESTPEPLPNFEDRPNCTFTVRVPRAYLVSSETAQGAVSQMAGGLEEICKRRAIWGAEVYTDDSDVVAAAVHSGWIKGDFGYFNEDIQDLFGADEDNPNSDEDLLVLNSKPLSPASIPADKDMHVTVLMLPPLQHYSSAILNNIHSRSWGSDHDGMSFMIHAIEFVDEPSGSRYVERTGAARRARMKEDLHRRREAAESLLGLGSRREVPVGA